MNELYRRNLAALEGRADEGLLESLKEMGTAGGARDAEDNPADSIELIEGRGGKPSLRVAGKLLHSKLDPEREARRIVEQALDSSAQVHIFLGFGLGYHIEAYLQRYTESLAVVVEQNPAILRRAMETRDLSHLLVDRRLQLLLRPDIDELRGFLAPFSQKSFDLVALDQFTRSAPGYYRGVGQAVEEIGPRRRVNMATLSRFGRLWVRNLARNLSSIAEAEDVGVLRERFEGIPALLLAAGPSLDEVLPQMEELRRRCLIIAVDTAAGALISSGHAPDIVVVVDPQYWNTRHLDAAAGREELLSRSILVSESSTHPTVFRLPVLRLFMGGSLFPLGEYLEAAVGGRVKLGAGGSVATTAWDLASFIGARRIYTAGLDLGFPEGRTHYAGGFFERLLHSVSDRLTPYSSHTYSYIMGGDPYYYPNNSGSYTLTDRRLTVYRNWFEEQRSIRQTPETLNLSRLGIRIEGFEPASLSQLLEEPDRRASIEAEKESLPLKEGGRCGEDRTAVKRRAADLLREMGELADLADSGLRSAEAARKAKDEGERRARLARLDQIDSAISFSAGKEVVSFLLQPVLEELISEASQAASIEETLLQSERIYRELRQSVAYHMELFRIRSE